MTRDEDKRAKDRFSVDKASDADALRYILSVLYNSERDELADRLMTRFGSFGAVFRATREELMSIEGVTERAAAFFTLALPFYRRALINEAQKLKIKNEKELIGFMAVFFCNENAPCEYIFCLDGEGNITHAGRLEGNIVRAAIGTACRYDAKSIVIVHFRPYAAGLFPEVDSLEVTREILRMTAELGIAFLDSLEYSPYRFLSLRKAQSGEFAEKSLFSATKAQFDIIPPLNKTGLTGLISDIGKRAKTVF